MFFVGLGERVFGVITASTTPKVCGVLINQ
jgi:hypothetical protein